MKLEAINFAELGKGVTKIFFCSGPRCKGTTNSKPYTATDRQPALCHPSETHVHPLPWSLKAAHGRPRSPIITPDHLRTPVIVPDLPEARLRSPTVAYGHLFYLFSLSYYFTIYYSIIHHLSPLFPHSYINSHLRSDPHSFLFGSLLG